MQVLSAEETLAAIKKATEPILRRLEKAEAIIQDNSYLVDTAEASRLSGIKDNRTLKKRFTPVMDNGILKFSKVEILNWKMDQSLPKAPELKIAS